MLIYNVIFILFSFVVVVVDLEILLYKINLILKDSYLVVLRGQGDESLCVNLFYRVGKIGFYMGGSQREFISNRLSGVRVLEMVEVVVSAVLVLV